MKTFHHPDHALHHPRSSVSRGPRREPQACGWFLLEPHREPGEDRREPRHDVGVPAGTQNEVAGAERPSRPAGQVLGSVGDGEEVQHPVRRSVSH